MNLGYSKHMNIDNIYICYNLFSFVKYSEKYLTY